jgi:hypothetical protein
MRSTVLMPKINSIAPAEVDINISIPDTNPQIVVALLNIYDHVTLYLK